MSKRISYVYEVVLPAQFSSVPDLNDAGLDQNTGSGLVLARRVMAFFFGWSMSRGKIPMKESEGGLSLVW